jgi:hypothetical protein
MADGRLVPFNYFYKPAVNVVPILNGGGDGELVSSRPNCKQITTTTTTTATTTTSTAPPIVVTVTSHNDNSNSSTYTNMHQHEDDYEQQQQQGAQAQDPHEHHQHHHEQDHADDHEVIQQLRRTLDHAQRKDRKTRKFMAEFRRILEEVLRENDGLVADVTKLISTCERYQNQLATTKRQLQHAKRKHRRLQAHELAMGQHERDRLAKQLVRQDEDMHAHTVEQQDVHDVDCTIIRRSSNNDHYRQEQNAHEEEEEDNIVVEESRGAVSTTPNEEELHQPKAIFYFGQPQQNPNEQPQQHQQACAISSSSRTRTRSKTSSCARTARTQQHSTTDGKQSSLQDESRGNVTCSTSSTTTSSTCCSTGTADTPMPIRNDNFNCSNLLDENENHEPVVHLLPLLVLQRHDESQADEEEQQDSRSGGGSVSGFRRSSILGLSSSSSLHDDHTDDETTTSEDHDDCITDIIGSATEILSCQEEVTSTSPGGNVRSKVRVSSLVVVDVDHDDCCLLLDDQHVLVSSCSTPSSRKQELQEGGNMNMKINNVLDVRNIIVISDQQDEEACSSPAEQHHQPQQGASNNSTRRLDLIAANNNTTLDRATDKITKTMFSSIRQSSASSAMMTTTASTSTALKRQSIRRTLGLALSIKLFETTAHQQSHHVMKSKSKLAA